MEILSDDSFPQPVSPFNSNATLYPDNLPRSLSPSPTQPLYVPPQKLRPIRSNAAVRNCGLTADSFPTHPNPLHDAQDWIPSDQLQQDFSFSKDDGGDSSVGVEEREPANGKRKRKTRKKLELFLERLVMKVMERQEQMHKQLLEVLEKTERERILREEAWKKEETERLRREEELRAQETSRSLQLISFIRNVLGHQIQTQVPQAQPSPPPSTDEDSAINRRWPDAEVQALITLRAALEHKFRVTGSKGSIWEEISIGMHDMGYHRSAKKCKEKWENINKYFKRTLASGKKRPENGKTCQYFHDLQMLHGSGPVNQGAASAAGEKSYDNEPKRANSDNIHASKP